MFNFRDWKTGGLAIMLCLLSLLIWCSPVLASEGGPAQDFSISGELADVPIGGDAKFIMAADPTEYIIAGTGREETGEGFACIAAVTFTVEQDHYDIRSQSQTADFKRILIANLRQNRKTFEKEYGRILFKIAYHPVEVVPRC